MIHIFALCLPLGPSTTSKVLAVVIPWAALIMTVVGSLAVRHQLKKTHQDTTSYRP